MNDPKYFAWMVACLLNWTFRFRNYANSSYVCLQMVIGMKKKENITAKKERKGITSHTVKIQTSM